MTAVDTRLAVYGTLAPGKPNHHQLDGMSGSWARGTVRGRLVNAGWAADGGYPALVLDPAGGIVEVQVFTSADLPRHWTRLDAFEGADYRRVAVTVATADAVVEAWIYVAAG
ncbi:gamma-glutamylcyclotransferase [Sphingomonas sp. SUN039]|uniref:gamma-glutamylcyclotransferase family protein n=1 Tax=Sphingomonas sp. SUN039 TaxID=2937787 RepID=UPI002164EE94|nr:gamma-glutamylcyclotransferase [Sphingomonas sp. SUN039]UVO54417.1 gamma-glutamylcyclotransferase [Sphingomonas sp. SUN039]